MKKIVVVFLMFGLFSSCKNDVVIDESYVISKFQENADKINSIEYQIQRIDTFATGEDIWNNKGIALIERNNKDKIFGFSFYGMRDDVPKEYIYDFGNEFEISKKDKTYKIEPGNIGFLGSPGGQMVHQNILALDSIYNNVSLDETENSYLLSYEFENDTVYNVSSRVKVLELTKNDFFPIKIKETAYQLGNKSVSISYISEIKINQEVTRSIREIKQDLKEYTILEPKRRAPSELLLKKLPLLELPELLNQNNLVKINQGKITLIDFWEVWCGPCIASLPKVENLKNKYSLELNVIGIVTEDLGSAIKLVKKKGTTFRNLVGNNNLKKTFNVNSWPRYFLVTSNGTIEKEYFGFSEQIERDIKEIVDGIYLDEPDG